MSGELIKILTPGWGTMTARHRDRQLRQAGFEVLSGTGQTGTEAGKHADSAPPAANNC